MQRPAHGQIDRRRRWTDRTRGVTSSNHSSAEPLRRTHSFASSRGRTLRQRGAQYGAGGPILEIETLADPARRQSCLETAARRRAWKRNDDCMGLFHAHSITACKATKRGHGHNNTRGRPLPPYPPPSTPGLRLGTRTDPSYHPGPARQPGWQAGRLTGQDGTKQDRNDSVSVSII